MKQDEKICKRKDLEQKHALSLIQIEGPMKLTSEPVGEAVVLEFLRRKTVPGMKFDLNSNIIIGQISIIQKNQSR